MDGSLLTKRGYNNTTNNSRKNKKVRLSIEFAVSVVWLRSHVYEKKISEPKVMLQKSLQFDPCCYKSSTLWRSSITSLHNNYQWNVIHLFFHVSATKPIDHWLTQYHSIYIQQHQQQRKISICCCCCYWIYSAQVNHFIHIKHIVYVACCMHNASSILNSGRHSNMSV